MANEAINKRAWSVANDTVLATEYPIAMRVGRTQHNIELSVALEYLRDFRQAVFAVIGSDPLLDGVAQGLAVATNEELLSELRKRLEKVR